MSKEQNGSHLKDTIIQLKNEQMKISAQVKWRLFMLNQLWNVTMNISLKRQ